MNSEVKYNVFTVISRQLKDMKKDKKSYLYIVFFLNMIASGIIPVIALYIPRVVIDYLSANNVDMLIKVLIIMVASSAVLAVIAVFCTAIETSKVLALRLSMFDKWINKHQSMDYSYLEDPNFRDRLEISTNAINSNNFGFEAIFHDIYKTLPLIVSIICYGVIIASFNWIVLLASLASTIIIIFINNAITKYVMKHREEVSRAERKKRYFYNTCYDFTYGKDIRMFNLEEKISNDYKKRSYNYISVLTNIANKKFFVGLLELFLLLMQDSVAYYFIIKGYFDPTIALSLGEVTLYVGVVIALSTTLRTVVTNVIQIKTNSGYSSDYYEFLDDTSLCTLKGTRKALDDDTLEIKFVDMTFKYPNTDKYIFENFNFTINKGEKLAIIGINGAGKSTLVKLMTGLFVPTSGKILVNGIDINEFDQAEYQKMFAVVFQDVNIYATSVINNVMGDDDDRQRAIECINRVGLKEKIESLPLQYDQPLLKVIEDEGTELSGGQNQKIAIARALYKDGKVVILDEPTASLDALAEADIYHSFNDLVKGKTAIYISHRLSSTKFCDKIVLLDDNKIAEYGNHQELMEKKGKYYNMFSIQGQYYKEGENDE